MANIITLQSSGEYIQMNNGLTNVFIHVLVLSGSNLAQTIDQKHLVMWLAEEVLTFQKCPKHSIFLTCFGCQICNN